MRHPQRPSTRAVDFTRAGRRRAVAALGSVGAVLTAAFIMVSGGYAVASIADLSISATATHVGQSGAVIVSGSKHADGALTIELRPPGNSWQNVTGACVGTTPGSTTWSCTLSAAGGRALGDHKVTATQLIGDASSTATTHFTVVPPPALAPATPPPVVVTPPPVVVTPPPVVVTPPPVVVTPPPVGPPVVVTPPPAGPPAAPTPGREPAALTPAPTPPSGAEPTLVTAANPAVELPTESLPDTERVRAFAPLAQVDRNDPAAPSALSEGLPNVWRDPSRLLYALGFGALFLLLVAIPAEVLNSTLEANSHRWRWLYAWALPFVNRVSRFMGTLPAWGSSAPVMIVLTSIAFGFADPNFGFDLTSLRLVGSLAIGLLLVVYLPSMITAALLGRRWQVPSAIITQPGAIVIAVLGVLASRMLEFSPGLLVGLVLGIELAASARAEDQRRAIVTRMLVTLGVSFSAWVAYSIVAGANSGSDETFLSVFVIETLVAAVHEGITGLLVALLPLMFLDGKTLFDQSKLVWVALAGPTAVAFGLLVLPTSDRLDADAPIVVWIAVFIGFCLTVAVIWAAFRVLELREQRTAATAVSEATAAAGEKINA